MDDDEMRTWATQVPAVFSQQVSQQASSKRLSKYVSKRVSKYVSKYGQGGE